MGISDDELDYLLASGRWTANLFSSVENLKFCVTLATADPARPGFPLIYVNKAFEIMTGDPAIKVCVCMYVYVCVCMCVCMYSIRRVEYNCYGSKHILSRS